VTVGSQSWLEKRQPLLDRERRHIETVGTTHGQFTERPVRRIRGCQVLALIDFAEWAWGDEHVAMNRAGKRRQQRAKRAVRHGESPRKRRQHFAEVDIDPIEARKREAVELVRHEMQGSTAANDGEVAPLIKAVARFAVPHLLNDFGLDDEHAAPFEYWLMAKMGDVLREPDVEGYLAWRAQCLQVA
jgi:hypothetical protein